jgi:hypothetical protein
MALRNRPFREAGLAALAGLTALGIALGGCNPIETWRDVQGISKNDPDPATAPFAGNMAAAEAAPYPNLGTVPPPPIRATSTTERQKLAQALVAERSATAALGARPPGAPQPASSPAKSPAPPPSPAAAAAAPVPPPPPAAATAPPPESAPAAAEKAAANKEPAARRSTRSPAEAPPQDSPLEVPQIRSRPEPETARPPLPPPRLANIPVPPPSPALPPAVAASAAPQDAPAPPTITPLVPPPVAAKPEPKRPPTPTTVATLERIDRDQITKVAALYKEQPGAVRVVAHAAPPAPGADPLAAYHTALESGQAVAKALAEAGIPANRIQTEAGPAVAGGPSGRIEIQFLP